MQKWLGMMAIKGAAGDLALRQLEVLFKVIVFINHLHLRYVNLPRIYIRLHK